MPGKYCLQLVETPLPRLNTSGQQYSDNLQTVMSTVATNQMPMFKLVIMPFRLQTMTSNHPLIEEVQKGIHKERGKTLRPTHLEVTAGTCVLANLFNNEMEHLLLLIDLAQTRERIFTLLEELETLASQLREIKHGLK